MTAFFVTATGTDIGKTFVCAALLRHWRAAGKHCAALKPVLSGFDPANANDSDAGQLLAALGRKATPQALDAIAPWRFAAALSPNMAAAREGRSILLDELMEFCNDALLRRMPDENVLIEGVGGIMAPLNDSATVLDWMAGLRLPILLVTGSYLGTVSHTLTALKTLSTRGLSPAAVIINESPESPVPLEETAASLAQHWKGPRILTLSRNPQESEVAEIAGRLIPR